MPAPKKSSEPALPSAEDVRTGRGRLTFQEAMSLSSLPSSTPYHTTTTAINTHDDKIPKTNFAASSSSSGSRRYMSRRRVWVTGEDLGPLAVEMGVPASSALKTGTSAFGGHVYAQSALAASRAFREAQKESGDGNVKGKKKKDFGIHTIHGFFSEPGLADRPFIYEVTPLASNPLFPNLLVTARQPAVPSTLFTSTSSPPLSTQTPSLYPLADAALPLGPVCFSAIVSFRPAGTQQHTVQESPPQERFKSLLRSRSPGSWAPAPVVDIEGILSALSPASRRAVGTFPGLEMRKVDMSAYNEGKPVHERKELILYRLLAPLAPTHTHTHTSTSSSIPSASSPSSQNNNENENKHEEEEKETEEEQFFNHPDAHISAHAYAADRNGLLMLGNHAGYGSTLARAASLSYTFVVHVDAAEAVMSMSSPPFSSSSSSSSHTPIPTSSSSSSSSSPPSTPSTLSLSPNKNQTTESEKGNENENENEGWWIQETSFPRLQNGRGIVYSKIWSPSGVHVATEYQDGIVRRRPPPRTGERSKGKGVSFKL